MKKEVGLLRKNLTGNETKEQAIAEIEDYIKSSAETKFRGKTRAKQALEIIKRV
jgi:hypothetical protein